MKQILLVHFLLYISTQCLSQTVEKTMVENWVKNRNIYLNNPTAPIGYTRTTDCDERPVYRKNYGDSISLFTWAGGIAMDTIMLKAAILDSGFNIYTYPSEVQDNGTVFINWMKERTYLWRNDTLYLLDDYNSDAAKLGLKSLEDLRSHKITSEEFGRILDELHSDKYPEVPHFKIIYFKGIFNGGPSYQFTKNENYLEETVTLNAKWTEDGVDYIEINLKTHTQGRHRFSSNLEILELSNCR